MSLNQKSISALINQLFEMEKKVEDLDTGSTVSRNFNRIKTILEEAGYRYHNPIGEKYNLTRLDCEAMIAGDSAENLRIVEVIKPIIYWNDGGGNTIVQKAVVITENSKA